MANKKLFLIPRVRDYLLDGTIHDRLEEIAAKYKIPEGRSEEFLDLTDAVMNGKIEISKMPQFIAQAFAVDEVTSKKIASDLAGYRLLPLEDFIPGVSAQIKAWGGIISDYPELRIEREKYTTEKLLEDYAKEIGLQLPDYIMKRFVFLAKGYLTKERARAATKTLMMRSLNIGGLELTDEQAEGVFKKLDQVDLSKAEDGHVSDIARNSAELNNEAILANRLPRSIEEDVLPPPLPPPLPIPAPQKVVKKEDATPPPTLPIEKPGKSRFGAKQAVASPKKKDFLSVLSTKTALTKEVPVISGSLIDESEEREVKDQAVKLEKKLKQVNDLSRGLASQTPVIVTDKVVEIFKATRQSKKSAVDFVDKYLRGMLDKHRALALLEDKYGLHIDQVNKVVDILDIAKQEQDISLKSKIVERDAKKVGAYDIDKNEKEVLELRHAALTKSMPTQASETVVTGARVSAARSKEEEIELQKSKIDPEKIAVAQKSQKPKPARVQLSAGSAAPQELGIRSRGLGKVSDVRYTPKLVGPVDELGTMTAADFRRLSSDPKEAAHKIIDSLKLLEEIMYEDRVHGVSAWRRSPINQLYLQMANEALMKGAPVTEIASSRRNRGDETLSPAEIGAIVELNAKIKF